MNGQRGYVIGGGMLAVLLIGVFVGLSESSGQAPAGNTATGETGTAVGMTAPDATFVSVDGDERQFSDYAGEKVMVFLFVTWCPSCAEGLRVLQENNDQLQDVNVIAVKTYNNAGRSGPSVTDFAQQYSPALLDAENWEWGEATRSASKTFNPLNRPSIYYLIDADGTIQVVSGAPAGTIDRIMQFAEE